MKILIWSLVNIFNKKVGMERVNYIVISYPTSLYLSLSPFSHYPVEDLKLQYTFLGGNFSPLPDWKRLTLVTYIAR